jgi:hypothetical protein
VCDPEGIAFIPPQMVEKVTDDAEMDHRIDEWWFMMLREKKCSPRQIEGRLTLQLIDEFSRWAASKGSKLKFKKH